jgi:TonB-linked SusC/RagA family outer membrane protein
MSFCYKLSVGSYLIIIKPKLMRHVRLLIAFILLHSAVLAQTRQITGSVKDKAGTGIPSVTIKVKGNSIQTATDMNGAFNLQAPTGKVTLTASSVGFAEKTIDVGAGESSVTFTLEESSEQLGEVVVTALGISKESKKVGYSVTTVDAGLFNKARETNVANSLEGQVAGLSVRGTNSGPGGTVKLLLRGLPSMVSNTSGNPLFVINGVPIDNTQRGNAGEWGGSDNGDGINNINPDDIETMTVLKGQAASALYGSRASNGVIMITTKAGKKGRKDFTVELNSNLMFEKAMNLTDFQYQYGQGDLGVKPTTQTDAIGTAYSSWGSKLDGSNIIGYDGNMYKYSAVKNNIQKFYETGKTFTNSVSLSKSSETGSFRLGVTRLDNNGIVHNSGLKRYSFTINADQNITDKLTAQVFANYIDQTNENVTYLSDAPMNVNNLKFLATNIDQATLAPGYDLTTGLESVVGGIFSQNPYFVVNKLQNNLYRRRLISSVGLKYNFTKWLYAQTRVGYDRIADNAFKIEPWGTAYRNTTQNNVFASGYLQNLDKSEQYELNLDGMLFANPKFNNIDVSAMVGANLRKNEDSKLHLFGGPFIAKEFYSYSNLYTKNAENSYHFSEVHSAFYSVDATYKGYLTLGTTGRYDAYSTLPKGNNTVFVPSVTAGFIFSDLVKAPMLDFGKFRVSYASTSNELTQSYRTQIYYSVQTNNYNGIPLAQYDLALPNGLLKPFITNEIELGTDLRFFGSRLNLDLAWFTKKTKNEIMPATLSRSTGFSSGYVATGSTKNTGIEALISGMVVRKSNFSWKASLNITTLKSKVLKTTPDKGNINLGTARETIGNLITAYVPGMEGPQIMGYDYKRDSLTGSIVVDGSGLPINGGKLVPLGTVLPKLYGGLNNELSFLKNFTLSFLIDYNFGNKVISSTHRNGLTYGLSDETLAGREGGLVVDGVTATGTKNTVNVTGQNYWQTLSSRITSVHVLDGDFIKLRQVAFSYDIPKDILNKTKVIKGAQLSLTARNLLILYKKADNIDPEESFGSTVQYYGIEGRNLPPTRSYGVNLKLSL